MSTPVNRHGAPAATASESLYIQLIGLLPRNGLSRTVGDLAAIELPEAVRPFAYRLYARLTGANLYEVELPLRAYPSVNAFFTRKLRKDLRPIHHSPGGVVSPVDGVVSAFGKIEDGKLVQTKGRLYEARELLGGHHDALPFEGGHFCTIYLSPKDYHRIHHPASGRVRGFTYNPGHLWPVNAPSVKQVDRLFAINERVCTYIDAFAEEDALGVHQYHGVPLALVMVGATCVGRMSLSFDELVTNLGPATQQQVHYQEGRPVEAGDELGRFNLGSTVVLLFGDPDFKFAPNVSEGAAIRLGEPLGTVSPRA